MLHNISVAIPEIVSAFLMETALEERFLWFQSAHKKVDFSDGSRV